MTNPFAPPTHDGSGGRRKAAGDGRVESPGVLEYFPEQARHQGSAIAWYFVAPVLVALCVAFIKPKWTVPSAVLAVIVLWFYSRRRRKLPGATFTIESSNLIVVDAAGHELLSVTLDELEEVTLDTKTIERYQESVSSGGIPEVGFVPGRVGMAIDNSRIELVTAKDVIPLTDFFTSSIDATDWFSKIRRFLRQNGWTPVGERGKSS